jgi:hypothetical protein
VADLTEAIIDYLYEMPDTALLHIGEVVPQDVDYPFVWLMKSAEIYADDLCYPPVMDYARIDIEVVSDDIQESRDWAAAVKKHLHAMTLNSLKFENDSGTYQYIHGIDVDDHDDDYLPRSVGSDDPLHVAALDINVIVGDNV